MTSTAREMTFEKRVIPSYTDSDVMTGWWANFEGFTVFYSEPNEDTIDPVYSIGKGQRTVKLSLLNYFII